LTVQEALNELLNVSADIAQAAVLDAEGCLLGASGLVAEEARGGGASQRRPAASG
jgi:hypothetical protein